MAQQKAAPETVVAEVMPESNGGKTVAEIVESLPALRAMVRVLAAEAELTIASDDFVMELMEKILQAETVDDVFAAQDSGTIAGKDFSMRPFLLRGDNISIRKSTFDAFPFYAMFQVTEIMTGDEITLDCGGRTFMAVLQALRERGYFNDEEMPEGRPLMITATESPNGAYLSLRPFAGAKPATASGKK